MNFALWQEDKMAQAEYQIEFGEGWQPIDYVELQRLLIDVYPNSVLRCRLLEDIKHHKREVPAGIVYLRRKP